MGTRADFYVGRGPDAEWLGSIAWDGYPDGVDAALLRLDDEGAFRARAVAYVSSRDDGTLPAEGWPWPWVTSHVTDFAYAFDSGVVYVSCFGSRWRPVLEWDGSREEDEDEDDEKMPVDAFPDMTAVQDVTFGRRSGLVVVSSPTPQEPHSAQEQHDG